MNRYLVIIITCILIQIPLLTNSQFNNDSCKIRVFNKSKYDIKEYAILLNERKVIFNNIKSN